MVSELIALQKVKKWAEKKSRTERALGCIRGPGATNVSTNSYYKPTSQKRALHVSSSTFGAMDAKLPLGILTCQRILLIFNDFY
jgi:hypothetical protein